jgi:alkanesulfonate monooxygenase SsuD/methylene tetrahydromethanopterin reductase-like flavin-dependent oxidoreductase (luciferase family)
MKIGVMLPNFEISPAPAVEYAQEAEQLGIHGVFSYDHLWPMAHPGLPSLSPLPLLAAASAVTKRIRLGTLVTRIGLEPDEVVVAAFFTLHLLSNGRVIAAMGTGDHKSDDENVAFGLNLQAATVRRGHLERAATRLIELGIETWIGGGAPATNEIATRLGCPVNIWAGGGDARARLSSEPRSTWGGQLPVAFDDAVARLIEIESAGAEWAVLNWQDSLKALVEVTGAAGIDLVEVDE